MNLQFTQKQKHEFLNHITLASYWYLNNQNSDAKPWGGISDSADKGRFVYEYILDRDFARGMGVWGQSLAVMNLLDAAPILDNNPDFPHGASTSETSSDLINAATLGANYLKVLQVTDFRLPKSIVEGFHGEVPISYGNDDFTFISLVCAYQLNKDKNTLELLVNRIKAQNSLMAENGSYPSFGGTFASGINNLEFLKLVESENLDIDTTETEECVRKIAEFGLTLQEKDTTSLRLLGGLYGQSDYGVSRNCIHHRSTAYSINFYLKLIGNKEISSLSSFGW